MIVNTNNNPNVKFVVPVPPGGALCDYGLRIFEGVMP
jgi:hypothetical protein